MALGVCTVCGIRPLRTKHHCDECATKMAGHLKRRVARWRAEGLCYSCGRTPEPGLRRCRHCLDVSLRLHRVYTARKAAAGKCVECGTPSVEASLAALESLAARVCRHCYIKRCASRALGGRRHWAVLLTTLERQEWKCAYTGEPLVLGVNDSIDHIYPIARFPERRSDPHNIEWVVRRINVLKGAFTRDEFLGMIGKVASLHPAEGNFAAFMAVPVNSVGNVAKAIRGRWKRQSE